MTKDELLRRASKQLRRYSQADPMADEIDAALALPVEPKAPHEASCRCEKCGATYLVTGSGGFTLTGMDCKCGHYTALNRSES